MFEFILNLIYKKCCLVCGKNHDDLFLCKTCSKLICFSTNEPISVYKNIQIFSATIYNDTMQKAIKRLKYNNKKRLAPQLGQILFEQFKKLNIDKNFLIVPAPLHKKRFKKRGFNQVELVCKEFSKLSGYSLNSKLIARVKDTKPQYNLHIDERKENMKDSFKVFVDNYNGENLLLVDDITTTGTTFYEMIDEFLKHNITKITCIALSSTKLKL